MALEAWVAGLSAGSSALTGGPGEALSRAKSVPFTGCCGLPLLCRPLRTARLVGGVRAPSPAAGSAVASVQPPIKGRSRTGTDKGNPTV